MTQDEFIRWYAIWFVFLPEVALFASLMVHVHLIKQGLPGDG